MTTRLRAKTEQQFDQEQAARRAFMAALRAAGWSSMGHGCYERGDEKIYIDEYDQERGVLWKWYMSDPERLGSL